MKKQLIIISILVISAITFISCSGRNSDSEIKATTAVTDAKGETHYYETVTDENNEILTDSNGNIVYAEIVTDEDKSYVTKENSTVFYGNKKENDTSISETNKLDTADNEVAFNQTSETTTQKPTAYNTVTTASTTEKETTTHSITDKGGWINKWY